MIIIRWNKPYIMEWLWFEFVPKNYYEGLTNSTQSNIIKSSREKENKKMTDSRLERIINQLADFDEQELDIIVKKINIERNDRRQAKINKLIENFRKTWIDLSNAGIDICYCEDIDESCPLNIDNIEFNY